MDAYDEALQRVLEIPPLDDESAGARRVVRCLFKPSFHPEVSISIVQRAAESELTVRVPARSVWSFINAQQGAPRGITDWVKPAVSVEHIPLPVSVTSWQSALEKIEGMTLPDGPGLGLDGMTVDVTLWSPRLERAFSVWFPRFDPTDDRHQLVRAVLKTAGEVATWDQSLAGLQNALTYLEV